ncbi:MAG: ATP-dependent protease, Lon family [Firmicutes bacterium]|nr:ATP-dependent protease, Lon family [Bacillota bacterium]
MKSLIRKLMARGEQKLGHKLSGEEQLRRQVTAVYGLLANLMGSDKLVMKAGKLDALQLMRSERLDDKVLALKKIVLEDPTIDVVPKPEEIPEALAEIEDVLADLLARRTVEESLERKIAERMEERHEEYLRELRMEILREEKGVDNPFTLKKYAELERLEHRKLATSINEYLRPGELTEVVGQEKAIRSLFAKIASPYPQHVILYGPPGVGKTTVARLILEAAKDLPYTPFGADARFVEVDGATLRWDPRDVTNPLLGSVHDPIYQGAKRDLADGAVPEPKLGLVTEAHGGILFIDEIGELDLMLQNKLLKVLEDKRVRFDSSYYDPTDPNVPKYIKKLFEEGAPADFILIGATTRDPSEINPALRSRCAEVFFQPLSRTDIQSIVVNAARRLGVSLEPEVAGMISEYTIEGRKATSLVADCYGVALQRSGNGTQAKVPVLITRVDLEDVIQSSRLVPYVTVKANQGAEVGKILGLGVSGFLGSVLEIEAIAFPAKGKGRGTLRFNETAGSMAKDSVFNAASVVRQLTGKEIADYDLHLNVVGGANLDGPSAGLAMVLALISAVEDIPLRQDVAVTGEISLQGKVKPVGGIQEKIYGAVQAEVKRVLVPMENAREIPKGIDDMEIIPVERVQEAWDLVFVPTESIQTRVEEQFLPSIRKQGVRRLTS